MYLSKPWGRFFFKFCVFPKKVLSLCNRMFSIWAGFLSPKVFKLVIVIGTPRLSLSRPIWWMHPKLALGSLLRWKSEAFQMGRSNVLWYRPDLNTFGSRCSWSPYKKPQKPLKPSNIMKHLGIHPQSIIFLNIMAHFNNSILEIFTNNLVTYLYGFALKLWYA